MTTPSRRWRGSSRGEIADGPSAVREAASWLVERIGAVPTEVDGTVYVGGRRRPVRVDVANDESETRGTKRRSEVSCDRRAPCSPRPPYSNTARDPPCPLTGAYGTPATDTPYSPHNAGTQSPRTAAGHDRRVPVAPCCESDCGSQNVAGGCVRGHPLRAGVRGVTVRSMRPARCTHSARRSTCSGWIERSENRGGRPDRPVATQAATVSSRVVAHPSAAAHTHLRTLGKR